MGDLDNSGSWTDGDYVRLQFDIATNRLRADEEPLGKEAVLSLFSFTATKWNGYIGDAVTRPWTLGEVLEGRWRDASTFQIAALFVNASDAHQLMADDNQCGSDDQFGDEIVCFEETANGGNSNEGFRMLVTIDGATGIRSASDSPAAASTDSATNFPMRKCKAGPRVTSASIRDPDALDTYFSDGDELTIGFSVDTEMRPVTSKWDIDKLLTFCTPCNPSCEREALRNGKAIDAEYNGLGTEYSGFWRDPMTLVITIINATLPVASECDANDGTANMEFSEGGNTRWYATTSWTATQAPMLPCYIPGITECNYGVLHYDGVPDTCEANTPPDQFGTCGLELYGRMLGPRNPFSWSNSECLDYDKSFFDQIDKGNTIAGRVQIVGSVGPEGTPQIAALVADDPDDADLTYGVGDELIVVFDRETDRSNATVLGTYSGDRLYVDGLLSFNAQLGQDYSGEWRDDSTFAVRIIDSSWRAGPPFTASGSALANNNCTATLRPGVTVRNVAGTSEKLNGSTPRLSGNVGRDEAPTVVAIVGDDPDFGDATVAYGDKITLHFDRAVAVSAAAGGPFAVGEVMAKQTVDQLVNFSAGIGAGYQGYWADASVLVITVTDGEGSQLHEAMGTIMVRC